MMETLIGLGLKSLLIAAVTLGLLHLTRRRSAADRSSIAHLGLFALVALPLASLALPALSVEVPAEFALVAPAPLPVILPAEHVDPPFVMTSAGSDAAPAIDWTAIAYAVPMIALLLVTLVALLRLFGLRGRAQVLVDPVWLSALAHAQRRMGFKNGTALLTSAELTSPISWGLMRPVILLNDEALGAASEAEAIIAHELAHVARLDWAKLMLARVATALFWFNPLAWLLAREAHQLREEAADDAVLAADISNTDYAQLLVGVARHECRGLLLGAHGISPGKGSLRRRVGRVLDSSLKRGTGGRSWVAGFAAGMLVMAAPLAALTLAPPPPAAPEAPRAPMAPAAPSPPRPSSAPEAPLAPAAPFERAIATTVTTAVSATLGAASEAMRSQREAAQSQREADAGLREADAGLREADRGMREADRGMREADRAMRDADRAVRPANAGRGANLAMEMRMLGVTPAYVAAIRAAGPQFRGLDERRMIELRVKGVTPQYIRALTAAGYGRESPAAIGDAAVLGLTAASVAEYARVGQRRSLADLIELRMMGVTPDYIAAQRRSGKPPMTKEQLIEARLTGVRPAQPRRAP